MKNKLEEKVIEVMNKFILKNKIFTAFDVTNIVNKNKIIAKHYKIKNIVHKLYFSGNIFINYKRELVMIRTDEDEYRTIMYIPIRKTVYEYPPVRNKKKKEMINIDDYRSIPLLKINDKKNEYYSKKVITKVDESNGIEIPKEVLVNNYNSASFKINYNRKFYDVKKDKKGRIRKVHSDFPSGKRISIKSRKNIFVLENI